MRARAWLLSFAAIAACSSPKAPALPAADRAAATIDGRDLLHHIERLSSDEFEGRAPGTPGEEKTVAYLTSEMQRAGLAVDVQWVPLVAARSTSALALDDRVLGQTRDFVAWSYAQPEVHIAPTEMVFVGYGIVAPEHGRDDFKDVDVRGKTVVFLVGDPFGGPLTYYGRWTYKYEIAAKKGAAAALIIHEPGPAGYGWDVVARGGPSDRYELETMRSSHVAAEGWIHESEARKLFSDFHAAKQRARATEFRPEPLAPHAKLDIETWFRDVRSRNVIGRLPGATDEHIVFSAHWDHFGKGPQGIFHGARDNASGVAWLLELAQAFAAMPRQRRTILFAAFTAEEHGLLGAKYYVDHPVFPLEKTLADINMDIMNPWGRSPTIVSLGHDRKDALERLLESEAARQGRTVVSDPDPEKGYWFRSDHFAFARRGVPALGFLCPGPNKPKREDYVAHRYHTPEDVILPDWDLSGAVDDTRLLFRVGLALAR